MKHALRLVVVSVLAGNVGLAAGQTGSREGLAEQAAIGPQMSVITASLMQVGAETSFFLKISEEIALDETQRVELEELLFAFQANSVRREADLKVAEAELGRLLTNETIDLEAVRAKIDEAAAIGSDVQMHQVESLLRAIAVLSHSQHMRILTFLRDVPVPDSFVVP